MSHISHFEDQERREEDARRRQSKVSDASPNINVKDTSANKIEESIWHFYAGGGKTPKSRFQSKYQPYARKISFAPTDFQIDLEDDEHQEALGRK